MKNYLENSIKEYINRREFIKLGSTSLLLSFLGCGGGGGDDGVPHSQVPGTTTPPGPQPQTDIHDYSGIITDYEGNPLSVNISLTQIDGFGNPTGVVFSDFSDQNGNYFMDDVVNGDYKFDLNVPSNYFGFGKKLKIISSQGNINDNIILIRKEPLDVNNVYRDSNNNPSILEMIRDISGNKLTDNVQRVRRFNGKVKIYLDKNNAPNGYLNSIDDALRQIEAQSGLSLFEEVNIERDSNINLVYDTSLGSKGLTQLLNSSSVNGVSIPQKVRIKIKDDLSQNVARVVTSREVGYALFGVERYSKDRNHVMFRDPNYSNTGDPLGGTFFNSDEGKALKIYSKLPIGLSLKDYVD